MALTYEEKCAVNRKNASRSTGPKTKEGKEKARQNAMTHGLRAETLALPGQDAAVLKELHDEWLDHYRPASPGMRAMLDHTVFSHVQFGRCQQFHAAAVADQARKAGFEFDRAQEDEVRALVKLLATEPADALVGLRRSAAGCRWLIARWTALLESFNKFRFWAPSERDEAIRLIGNRPETEHLKSQPDGYDLRYFNLYSMEHPSAEGIAWLLDPKRLPDTLARCYNARVRPDMEKCRAAIREVAEENLADLDVLEELLRTEIEEPGREGAADRALLLDGPEGAKYLRYAQMHHLAFHRSFKGFLAGEPGDQRAEEDDATPVAPAPIAQPAPSTDDRGVSVLDITAARSAPNEANPIPDLKPGEGYAGSDYATAEEFKAAYRAAQATGKGIDELNRKTVRMDWTVAWPL